MHDVLKMVGEILGVLKTAVGLIVLVKENFFKPKQNEKRLPSTARRSYPKRKK
jgi:hypothetical protein